MMKFAHGVAALVAAALLAAPARAAPLEAYGGLPAIEAVTVSPDGGQLALVVTDGERRTVAVQDVATKAFKARADFGDVPVQAIRWAGERHLLITTAVQFDPANVTGGLRDWRRVHAFDVTTQTLQPLLGNTASGLNNILRAPEVRMIDGRPAVFVEAIQFIRDRGNIAVYQLDLETGRGRLVQTALVGSRRWLVGDDGRTVARQIYNDRPLRWTTEVREQQGWRTVHTATEARDMATLVGLGRDGQSVIYAHREEDGGQLWRTVRLDGAPAAPPLAVPSTHRPLIDPQSGRVLGHSGWDGDAFRVVYLDPADDEVMATVRDTYPAVSTSIGSWSNDRNRVVAFIDRPGRSPGYALFDLAARRAEWIALEYPDLAEAEIGVQSRVRFKAADGREITGYLTRPPGQAQARNLPLIVYPHDGPADRDTPGFNWLVQAMASRGYAVLQLNFRGSSGLGEDLRSAGEGEIGRKMQTDLSDGVSALAASGLIDPERVCIVGRGYGGYAALAGATFDPHPYRCAVSIGGFFELRWPASGAGSGSDGAVAASRRLGASGPDDPKLVHFSPLRQAAGARSPVLLIHGENDTVIPPSQSEAMAAALRKAGKSVDLLLVKDGDRRLTRAAAGMETLTATMAFVEKHNPPN